MLRLLLVLFLALPFTGDSQQFHTYVGRVETDSVLLAWGTTQGNGNTIGRESESHGPAEVRINGRTYGESAKNWTIIRGLSPNREYPYAVTLNGREIGAGTVRTLPEHSDRLAFLVIGDYGTGGRAQYEVASAMAKVARERSKTDNPVRFVLTTGDNIYAYRWLGFIRTQSGDRDRHWRAKFFEPYSDLLLHVPFYPTLGNHDGGESESDGDLGVYLDNFFFPTPKPSRYYSFSVAGLADFFALDSTDIATSERQPIYAPGGTESRWLEKALAQSKLQWKIAYFHHPPFNAGPGHGPSLDQLRHWVDLFGKHGVQIAFSGHEHNFQWSKRNERTAGVQFVITGAGGELRSRDVRRRLEAANIAAWAPQCHFLLVEIEGRSMTVNVLGSSDIIVRDRTGGRVSLPFRVSL